MAIKPTDYLRIKSYQFRDFNLSSIRHIGKDGLPFEFEGRKLKFPVDRLALYIESPRDSKNNFLYGVCPAYFLFSDDGRTTIVKQHIDQHTAATFPRFQIDSDKQKLAEIEILALTRELLIEGKPLVEINELLRERLEKYTETFGPTPTVYS
jgi:hypothetical protein